MAVGRRRRGRAPLRAHWERACRRAGPPWAARAAAAGSAPGAQLLLAAALGKDGVSRHGGHVPYLQSACWSDSHETLLQGIQQGDRVVTDPFEGEWAAATPEKEEGVGCITWGTGSGWA